MSYQYRVAADIEYLDGALKGLLIPAGYNCRFVTYKDAQRVAAWLERVRQTADFVRATGTGKRYTVRGGIEITRLPGEGA